MGFDALQQRLTERLREQVRNGQSTERGLARRAGISQPHVHNVLKGVRALTPALADRILRCMGWSILDLVEPEEMLLHATQMANHLSPKRELAVLVERLGPGYRWPCRESEFERYAVDCRLLAGMEAPVVGRLASDCRLDPLLKEGDLVLLDCFNARRRRPSPAELYLVDVGGTVLVRWVRSGPGRLYLISPDCEYRPREWQVLAPGDGDPLDCLAARVIPLPHPAAAAQRS